MTPKTVHLVSHTHWDREWYLTYHTFRVKLVAVVRRVLEALENDESFRHFLLDGQSIILEDYLEVHPEDEERLRQHVSDGTLSIGPWYILPDEFLIGAESTVRNLLIGHTVGARFGPVQKVGYMPDSFGHVAQVPQLLRQAGIESFIYQRGCGNEIDELGHEYIWEAPDGSEVLAIQLCEGYCNGAGLGFEEIWHAHTQRTVCLDRAEQKVRDLFEKMARHSNGDIVLINNGCDHFPPQQEFGRIFERLSEAFSETTFRHTGLREFVDAVRASGVATGRYRGELLGGKLSHILSGVWSARMPLKQLNDRCQTLLAGQWEPLAAYAHFMLGRPYPGGLIDYAWKLLLKNHPHDSICGCSIDEVHQDMLPRFDGVIETGEESISETLRGLAPTFARAAPGDAQTVLCLANTLPFSRREVIERLVVLQPCCKPVEQLHLLDPDGREIPFGVLELHHVERFWGVDYRTMLSTDAQLAKFDDYCESFGERILKQSVETNLTDRYLLLQFSAELPPLGHANYRLTDASGTDAIPQTSEPVIVDGNRMHNGLISVTVHPDGTFDLLDQRGGRSFAGLNRLEDIEDIGDEYDHCPAAISETHTAEGIQGELGVVRSGGLAGAIEVSWVFPLPAEISPDRASRSEELVDCAVHTRITLRRGSPVVDIELAFDNQACDHRLQTCFPVGFSTDTVISDGHFYTNERPVVQPEGRDWCQPPAGTYPQQEFSLLQDADGGLALLNRGLPEIEAERDCLRLTLLRCVGWLSRDDFETRRRSNAGPTIPTPDAQCPGPQQFRYAVTPFQGDCHSAGIKQLSQAWHTPVVIVQGVEDQAVPGTSLLELTSTSSAVTAVKRHVARNTLVLRLYNLADDPVTETLILGREITAAWRINLLEERGAPLQPAGRHVTVTLTPHEIVSIEVAFD